MSDKQRQEFMDRYAEKFNVTENNILVLLADYDKLNGDKWEGLREFVERELGESERILNSKGIHEIFMKYESAARIPAYKQILAEILRLEKEEK
jgi:hypothetical protein